MSVTENDFVSSPDLAWSLRLTRCIGWQSPTTGAALLEDTAAPARGTLRPLNLDQVGFHATSVSVQPFRF